MLAHSQQHGARTMPKATLSFASHVGFSLNVVSSGNEHCWKGWPRRSWMARGRGLQHAVSSRQTQEQRGRECSLSRASWARRTAMLSQLYWFWDPRGVYTRGVKPIPPHKLVRVTGPVCGPERAVLEPMHRAGPAQGTPHVARVRVPAPCTARGG